MTRKAPFLRPAVILWCVAAAFGGPAAVAGPRNATVLIIRHAEKPDEGDGLTPAGEARAKAYVAYFQRFTLHAKPLKLDAIFAAADSRNSRRPRLTVEPLARALGLTVNMSYKDKDFQSLANGLQSNHDAHNILVCWHHGEMRELLQALGGNPDVLLPAGHWPGDEYRWVIALSYGSDGQLQESRRIEEGF